jgi:hypothetical protein
MCEPDPRWSSILAPHAYSRWVGYRTRPSTLRYLQGTLRLTHLQASHRGSDNDCLLQCLLLQRIVTPMEAEPLPHSLPNFSIDDHPLAWVPQITPSCLHRATPLQPHRNTLWAPLTL